MDLYSTLLEVARRRYGKIVELSQAGTMDHDDTLLSHVRTCVLTLDVALTKSDVLSSKEHVQLRMTLARLLLKFTTDYEILDEHLLKAVLLICWYSRDPHSRF